LHFLCGILEKIILDGSKLKVPSFAVSVPVFKLNAGFISKLILQKGVYNLIILVGIFSKPICIKKLQESLFWMPERTASAEYVSLLPYKVLSCTATPFLLKIGLNSLKERAPGPWALMRNRLLSANLG
jgi:hypothetical protein